MYNSSSLLVIAPTQNSRLTIHINASFDLTSIIPSLYNDKVEIKRDNIRI